jgi:phenylpropionate dioxygenase-like ring-hydroxylating dioxygenase large terminal subunit
MAVDTSEILRDIRDGMVPAHIYGDPEIFELERERIFARAWCFLAHESEIPSPGDYVVRRIVDDSFIVVRDEGGEVRVLFNMCIHRGMQVCRAERGNASHFRCPYHAWTYKNTGALVGLPFHKEAYGGEDVLPRNGATLLPAPRVGTYDGLIFASLDPEAEDLEDYLAGYRFFLDFYLRQSEAGVEFRGPQRWRVKANWKISSENFSGDSYHTPYTHQSVVDIGLFGEPKAHKRKLGALYQVGPGGGTSYKLPEGDFDTKLRYVGYPQEMIDRMRGVWSPEQIALIEQQGFMPSASGCQPNLAMVHNWPRVAEGGPLVPFISVRLWQPISATESEIYSWFVVDRLAPEWYKKDSYKAYLMCFGSSGMFEQDDVENWASITQVSKGQLAKSLRLNNRMGLSPEGGTVVPPIPDWPAPGQAFVGFGEYGQRALLERWAEMLDDDRSARVNGRRSTIGGPVEARSETGDGAAR